MIVAPFIYDSVRLLLLSKTDQFPNGLANSSGHLGKHIMSHIGARVLAAFDDRHINVYMGPSAQKHTIDDFNADNFDHKDLGFIRGAQISVGPAGLEGGPIASAMNMPPPPGVPRWGAGYRDFFAKYYTRHAVIGQTENLPYADQVDRSRSERARRLGTAGAAHDLRLAAAERGEARRVHAARSWRRSAARWARRMSGARPSGPGAPGAHHEGGMRMGSNPRNSVVNKYGQSWDIPNLFIMGSATFPTIGGFNPTLTIQALAYMTADAIVNRYRKNPGRCLTVSADLKPNGGGSSRAPPLDAQNNRNRSGSGAHGNRKNRCRHRRRGRGRRSARGRARQGRHEGDRARARAAS